MFSKVYKNTFKEIVRFPATSLSLIIFLVFCFFFYSQNYGHDKYGFIVVRYSDTINTIVNDIALEALIFSSIFVSFLIVYDVKNFFYDIERATLIRQRTYYLAKFFAFFTFSLIINILLILDQVAVAYSYSNGYTMFSKPFFTFETLIRFLIAFLWITIPTSLTSVCLPMSVTAISKSRVLGIISGTLYSIFCAQSIRMANPDLAQHFLTPSTIIYEFLLAKQNDGMLNAIVSPDTDAIMNIVLVLLADSALFLLSYFIYSKREYRC